jgi:hypothetical protein
LKALLFATLLAVAMPAAAAPTFVFATVEEARAVLGQEDDYLLATTALERRVRLRSAQPVERAQYAQYMAAQALPWPEDERLRVAAVLGRIAPLLERMNVRLPERILLVRAAQPLEENSPHTRANAIMLPASWLTGSQPRLLYALTHELFHVLSRNDPARRDRLYAAIGFQPCERTEIPAATADLRVTNPDAVLHRHAVAVRYRGEPVEAMPYPLFTPWVLVDRRDGVCRARAGAVKADELEGLFEQIGRNTNYLAHPEEIVADNFAILLLRELGAGPETLASPQVLERIRQLLAR